MADQPHPQRRPFLIFLLIIVPVLLFIGWSQASLNLSFIRPASASQTVLIFFAFIILGLILARILLKLYVERQMRQLGSRFKTKMVVAFLALTLVPVCFLSIFAYGLLNHSVDRWFGIPFDVVRGEAGKIVQKLEMEAAHRARRLSNQLANTPRLASAAKTEDRQTIKSLLTAEVSSSKDKAALFYSPQGQLLAQAGNPELCEVAAGQISTLSRHNRTGPAPISLRVRSQNHQIFLAARPILDPHGQAAGTVIGATRLPEQIESIAHKIQQEAQKYDDLTREQKIAKRTYLLSLSLITLLLLFVATWLALFVSKQVTVPIEALATATHEVSRGNLGFQITSASAGDELGSLIRSFNEMTRQLQENRREIERTAHELQAANLQLEERGNTMEAILENIPAGVISFDSQEQITQINSTCARMLKRDDLRSARTLSDLFPPEDVKEIHQLFRRARRQGAVTREIELNLGGRRAWLALTLTSIRTRHGNAGSVLVLDDLTEFLHAQKALAWQEVAQRIAHEIKNPLTPIQLSAERICRWVEKPKADLASPRLIATLRESSRLIAHEVKTLKTLVDEFSRFARFPSSHPVTADLNSLVELALRVFAGRLDGIVVRSDLAEDLPMLQLDPDQMKRVIVNLIDNAAEAVDQSTLKEICVRTAFDSARDVTELVVEDTGPGIPPEAKERLFLPFFSTKRRGTGLGLAIVSRIISEHHGTIRVEENHPAGTKFVIELPVEHLAVRSQAV
jgi:two-component system nitrogen regulation sensor histidine kinase NtrY